MNEVVRKVFAYDGSNVTFASKNKLVMVNATEMAKPFGKSCNDWLKTEQSKRMVAAISTSKKIDVANLVKVTNGGNTKNGTWMHEDVALVFAQWLSPEFYIWCNDKIKELLLTGSTSVQRKLPQSYAEALRELACQVEENERLALENKNKQEQIEEQRPKVAFADAVLSSPDSILIGELAKILCQRGYQTGEIRLYEKLRNEGYLCSSGSDYNMPMQRYLEMGLFEVTKGTRSGSGGIMRTTRTTKVTPRGQLYFINKFANNSQALFTE